MGHSQEVFMREVTKLTQTVGKGVGVVQTTKVSLRALVIFAHPRLAFDLVNLCDLVHIEWLFHSRGKSTEKNACALPPLWFGDFPSRCLQFLGA